MCAGTSVENSANNTPPENHSPGNSSQRIRFPLYLVECFDAWGELGERQSRFSEETKAKIPDEETDRSHCCPDREQLS